MSTLFAGYTLPDDERSLEILAEISSLYEENAFSYGICAFGRTPRVRHQKVSILQRKAFIELSKIIPDKLEEMLRDEEVLSNFLELADRAIEDEIVKVDVD